jgi:hypothetical protein
MALSSFGVERVLRVRDYSIQEPNQRLFGEMKEVKMRGRRSAAAPVHVCR